MPDAGRLNRTEEFQNGTKQVYISKLDVYAFQKNGKWMYFNRDSRQDTPLDLTLEDGAVIDGKVREGELAQFILFREYF